MYFKVIILLGFLSGCLATSDQLHETIDRPAISEPISPPSWYEIFGPIRTLPVEPPRLEALRVRRSAGQYDLGHIPVLYSPDGRHSLDVLAGYTRGNRFVPPDYRGGLGYTWRF